jgi:hypothetical protein
MTGGPAERAAGRQEWFAPTAWDRRYRRREPKIPAVGSGGRALTRGRTRRRDGALGDSTSVDAAVKCRETALRALGEPGWTPESRRPGLSGPSSRLRELEEGAKPGAASAATAAPARAVFAPRPPAGRGPRVEQRAGWGWCRSHRAEALRTVRESPAEPVAVALAELTRPRVCAPTLRPLPRESHGTSFGQTSAPNHGQKNASSGHRLSCAHRGCRSHPMVRRAAG